MPIQFPQRPNRFNMVDTVQNTRLRDQGIEANKLALDAGKEDRAEDGYMKDMKWLSKVAPALADLEKRGVPRDQFMPAFFAEADRRNMPLYDALEESMPDWRQSDPGALAESFIKLGRVGEMALAGQPLDEFYQDMDPATPGGPITQQRNQANNQITQIGATNRGPTSPMQNYGERERLVQLFGEGSSEVTTFDSYVRAPQYQTIDQVPTRMDPGGGQNPLSTLESEAGAANTISMAEGEGGRGRAPAPGGGYEDVAGTQAAVDADIRRKKAGAGAFMKSIQAQTVVQDVYRLDQLVAAGAVPFGREAALQEKLDPIAQSEGYRNAKGMIESVKGNVGIDSLLRIKASGAGLGQVPQSQLDMLSRLLGELDMKQGEEQFMYTWARMGAIYEAIMMDAAANLYELDVEVPNIGGDGLQPGRIEGATYYDVEGNPIP